MAPKAITDKQTLLDLLNDPSVARTESKAQEVFGVKPNVPIAQQEPKQSPKTGGPASDAEKLSTPRVTSNPSVTRGGYESARSVDLGGLYNMGGRNATGSFKEYTSTPKAAVVGALDAVEGMAKSPFGMAAGYYANKDTYLSKREAEGSKTLINQVQERSQQYKKDNKAKNDAKAEKFAKISDSINLYGKDSSIRNFMNRTKEEMQEIKDETGAKFTLADMSYTMGQMAPSIAMGKVGGNLALLNMGVGDVMAATAGLDSVASGILEFGSTLGSIGSMYAQVYGNSFDEARAQGADAKTAADYAQAHAMVEAGTELLGGGIPGMNEGLATKVFSNLAGRTAAKYGGAATGKLLPKVASTIGGILSSPAGEMALDVLGEGVEEMISEVYDPWIAQTTIDPNRPDATFEDIALAGLSGIMVSAMMQGGVKIFKTAAENGQAYRYNEQTKKIEKPESTSGTTNEESGVVPESSKEAAKDGAPTVSEAVDLENRRSAKAFINAFLTTAAPWARDAFKEGGRLYERYGETISPDMVDNFAVDNNQVGKLLEGDPTWEEIDAFMRDYAIPQIQAAYDLSLANEAVDSFKNRIENPTFDNVTPDMISDDYAAQYVSSNPGLNLSLEDAKQRILQEMRGKTGKELSKFAEATGLRDALYGPDFLDIQARARNASRQTKRSNITSEKYPGRVRVEGKGVLDFRQFADEAATAMGLKRFEDIPNEKMSKVVEEFKKAVADERAKIEDFVSSLNDRGKATGLKVELSDNLSSAEAGEYDAKTNTLKLNANTIHTLDAFRFFTAHELIHHAFNILKGTPQLDAFKSYMDNMGATLGRDLAAERELYKSKPEYKEEWKAEWETYARFFSEFLGSPEMMIELAAGNPSMLMDVIGYVDSVNSLDKTSNPEVRKAQKAIKADLEMARDGKLEAAEEKKNAPLMKDVPDTVKKASKQKGGKNNTVAEAMQAAVETSPSKSAREAKAKITAETSSPANATEEVFQPKSTTPVEMPVGADALGFQRAPSSEGGLTFQQVLAGEGKAAQRRIVEEGKALEKANADKTTAVMPGLPNTELRVVDTLHKDGTSVRTIRAVPDDSHGLAKNGKNRILEEWEKKKLKALNFKHVGNGVYEHDFTDNFWGAVQTENAEAVKAQSGAVDDRDALREYQGKTDGDGAWFSFAVGKKGKEQIRLLFRRADGSRVRSTTLDKETYKNLGFKYEKDNPNGPGFYADYSDKLSNILGLPATTKSMRAEANRMYNDRRNLFRGDILVPARNEKYAGFDIGYIPATNTVGLYRDGKLVFIAPYSEVIIDTVLGRTTAPEEIFKAKSDAKARADEIVSGISNRYTGAQNESGVFPSITATEESEANRRAENLPPLTEEERVRVAQQEKKVADRKDTVRIEFRDTDEPAYYPISTLKQMTTLTSNLKLAGNGLMYDDLYSPEFTPEEVAIDPRTGTRRRLTGHEIPERIIDNATGRVVWDAQNYDETSEVPGKGISFDREWFRDALNRAAEFDAEQDKEAKRLAKQAEATNESFDKEVAKEKSEEAKEKAEKAKREKRAESRKTKGGLDKESAKEFSSEINEALKSEEYAEAIEEEAKTDPLYNLDTEDEAVTNTEEERDEAYGGEIDEGAYYDNLASQYSDETTDESDVPAQTERRGWKNMDLFFANNESSPEFKEARRQGKLRAEEIEGIKRAALGEWDSVDLASTTADRLVEIYRGAERRKDLMNALEFQRDRARRQERFDDYAVLDKRLSEVRELDKQIRAREEETSRRTGSLDEISARANATEKRRSLQAAARTELEKAEAAREKYDKLLEAENTKKNQKKRNDLLSEIRKAEENAAKLNAQADKIGEAVSELDARKDAELEASKRELTDAEKKQAKRDTQDIKLQSYAEKIAQLERDLPLAREALDQAETQLAEESKLKYDEKTRYYYTEPKVVEEIERRTSRLNSLEKRMNDLSDASTQVSTDKFGSRVSSYNKEIEDTTELLRAVDEQIALAEERGFQSRVKELSDRKKKYEAKIERAIRNLQAVEKKMAETENSSDKTSSDKLTDLKAEYEKEKFELYKLANEKLWKDRHSRSVSNLKKDVKRAQERVKDLETQIEQANRNLESEVKKTRRKLDLTDLLMSGQQALSSSDIEYTVGDITAPEYANSDTTVDMEDDMLDVHPLEQRMRNSDGDIVSPLAEAYYKSKPGSMNADGQLQLYYADYMDADNSQLGTGLFTLYTDPNASDYQTEPVYAAIERPLYFDDTIGDSVLTEDTIREALSELGIEDETALNIPRNGGEPMTSLLNGVLQSVDLSQERNLLQALQEVATTVEQNTDAVKGAQVMGKLLPQLGYDGVLFPDGAIVFDENLIKSASDTNPANSNNTIGATLGSDFFSKLAEELESLDDILNDDELNRQWDAAREKYGTMNGAPIPNKVSDDGMRVTTSLKNLWINENTNVEGTPLEKANYDMILRGMVDYTPMTDKQALKKVGDWLRKGNTGTVENPNEMTGADFQKKFDSWMDSGDIRSKVSVLQGGQLMAEMANFAREHPEQVTNDMARGWEQLVAKVALGASRTGQILQAYAALKKLTPQGRLGYIQGMVEQLQKELNETKGALRGKLKNVKLTIDQKYIDQINAAKTQEELDKAEDDICKHIAEQIPATLESRVNAYRYLCMLGSARTHVRNIVSNAMMALVKKGAREASGLAQDIFVRSGDKTVSFVDRPTKAMKEFARADAVRQEEALRFGGKQGFQDKINDYRKSFGNSLPGKFLEKLSQLNGGALEKEDWWFLKLEYQTALARYMAAHKDAQGNPLTPEYFKSNTKAALEELNRAREYALNQAWDATYRQSNVVADALNKIERKSSLASIIIEGLVPFKRTPANILIQGVRYSPIGLLETVGKAAQMLKSGDVTGAEVADRFGQGLTGTGITILGAWLAAMGFAKASGSDSDREEYYDQMLGNQRYSLHIGDSNYTIDWLTPISMPLMAGVELVEGLKAEAEMDEEEDFSVKFNRLVSAISTMADPVTNLSMLQGINEALSAYKDNQVGALASNAVSGYALQFVPTASGQALRTIDPTRRSTYAPSDSKYPFGKFGEEFVNKLKNKSLIANKLLGDNNEYVDMWGRAETGEENRALQAFNQFIAPWYARDYNRTTVDDKLAEVFAANGQNTGVLPATPQSNFSIGGTSYKLSGDDYEKVKKVVGNLSYRGLEDAFNLEEFNELDAETQTSIIKNIYSYAKQIAKIEYAERNGIQVWTSEKDKEAYLKDHPDAKGFVQESYVGKIERLEALGMSAAQYFTIKALSEQYSNKEKKRQFLRTLGLSYEQREVFL